MIEINLLPQEYRKKEPRFKGVDISQLNLQSIPVMYIVASVVGFLIVAQAILFILGLYAGARLNGLTKVSAALSPDKKEYDALSARSVSTGKKIKAIDELLVKRFNWSAKLNDLSDSLTPGIWLTGLSYDERSSEKFIPLTSPKQAADPTQPPKMLKQITTSRYMTLSGYASAAGEQGAALVGKFIQSMKDNPEFYGDFSDIVLGSIRSEKVEDQEVMDFKITCLFKDLNAK